MRNLQNLNHEISRLQQHWDLLSDKLTALEKQRILETRAEEKFRLQSLINEIRTERDRIDTELTTLQDQLAKTDSDTKGNAGQNDDPVLQELIDCDVAAAFTAGLLRSGPIPIRNTASGSFDTPNPYSDWGRIVDPKRVFDRERELGQILARLGNGMNVSLVGKSQVGKSSLLTLIRHQASRSLKIPAERIVYLDMQLISGDADFFGCLTELLKCPETPAYQIARALRGDRWIVCLDEIEKMKYAGFTSEVRAQLRGLCDGNNAPLTLVVASRTPLDQLFPDSPLETSPLASVCEEIRLGNFSPETTERFLRQRVEDTGWRWTDQQIRDLIDQTEGHPGQLQQHAFQVFANRTERQG